MNNYATPVSERPHTTAVSSSTATVNATASVSATAPFGIKAESDIRLPPHATRAAFNQIVADGQYPHLVGNRKPGGKRAGLDSPMALLPHGADVVRTSAHSQLDSDHSVTGTRVVNVLAKVPQGYMFAEVDELGVEVRGCGGNQEEIFEVVATALGRAPAPPAKDVGNTVPIKTWYLTGSGAQSQRSRIEVPRWADIARNYPVPTALNLADLMHVERPQNQGRLVLWHGAPGTGKTTAIRAMAHAWQSWCDIAYLADPERAFADTGYMMELLYEAGKLRPKEGPARHLLIVAEDSDEFLRADARRTAGAALGRLLNLADGILGQGSNVLFLLTTNEELRALHPALVRPGRALATVEFHRFDTADANEWLADSPVLKKVTAGGDTADGDTVGTATVAPRVTAPATLAELYEQLGTVKRIQSPELVSATPTGMYL
ncbi:MAG: ATP-binding protein [Cellulomonadaceae bacterium]|jgi:hypothetical protein|nr:ATP-binding protein [Cellulomonadaceae bacterium]